jgi:hypothetical protein
MRKFLLPLAVVFLATIIYFFVTKFVLISDEKNEPKIKILKISNTTIEPAIGNQILEYYASPSTTIQRDLTLIANVVENFSLLNKGDNPIPLGSNEEIAKALLGKNRSNLVFLSSASKALNGANQLVDRLGTPLYFHAESRDKVDIRSAGEDRVMWTADDVQRSYNGTFLSPESLTVPSLYKETKPGEKPTR